MMRELGKQEAFRESVALCAQTVSPALPPALPLGPDLSSTDLARLELAALT